ncbi:pericentrin isoform X2 [Bombina bombina]|uniref:pericentrin isoform X2 n=1 Tax=Bombina bombina TaxID=8345 RepID=UPI00235A7A4E|nr:pericentrin isoform X2 [Bombina bombina]
MDGTADEQRRKKVQAGRAKLANFRQRKTKGEGTNPHKKTSKRKSAPLQSHDVQEEENSLGAAECESVESELENSLIEKEISSGPVSGYYQQGMPDTESGFDLKQDASLKQREDVYELQESLQEESQSQHIQEKLQNAVHDRNDIIAQLSTNLHQALENREEMLEEAQLLSSQIQDMQLRLQETTKEKENQMVKLENVIREQEKKLEELEKKLEVSECHVSTLQQELSERNLSVLKLQNISAYTQTEHTPCHILNNENNESIVGDNGQLRSAIIIEDSVHSLSRLVTELKGKLMDSEALRQELCKKLEEQMHEFQKERSYWEQKHEDIVAGLTVKLQRAEEQTEEAAVQAKHEKERLNEELRDLKDQLRLETENTQALKLQHDQILQSYMQKLQNLEDERDKMHRDLLDTKTDELEKVSSESSLQFEDSEKRIQEVGIQNNLRVESFRHELEDLKKNLNRVKAHKDFENYETALFHGEENNTSVNQVTNELDSMDKYLIPTYKQQLEQTDIKELSSEHSLFELDSDFVLEQSLNSTTDVNTNIYYSPMPITSVLAGGATFGTLLDPESFAVYLSSDTEHAEEQNQIRTVCDKNLEQKCALLIEQLHEKERQLKNCSNALEDSLVKWREVTADLLAARSELEQEKTTKNENWIVQQRIVEELKIERDAISLQLKQQEELVNELQQHNIFAEEQCHEKEKLRSTLSAREECLSQLMEEKKCLEERLCSVMQELDKELEKSNSLQMNNVQLSHRLQETEKMRESDKQEFDNKLNSKGVEYQSLCETITEKEAEFAWRERDLNEEVSTLKQMCAELESKLQEQIEGLNVGFQNKMDVTGEEWKEKIQLLKQEHESELSQLQASHKEELVHIASQFNNEKQRLIDELKQLEESHSQIQQSLVQAQCTHHVELEALRLSLTNMHAAHLELSQSNLHREKDEALLQLRDEVNDKRAQEVALLQGRYQFDIEQLRNNHCLEMEQEREKHSRELEKMREQLSKETSSQDIQEEEHVELETCQQQTNNAIGVEPDRMDQFTLKSSQYVKETEGGQDNLKISQEVKSLSRPEMQYLWAQLDKMVASRHDLHELKEQLLVRSAQVEEIAKIKQDFEQQKLQLKCDHEKEMEELRIYFEEKSRATEENYREDLEILHQRLREMKDEDKDEVTAQCSYSADVDGTSESDQIHLLQQLTDQLEQHKEEISYLHLQSEEKHKQELDNLQAALTHHYKEDLVNMKMDLSDRYIFEIEALKKKHCLELEQLRAKLCEEHIREITRLHLHSVDETDHQVESESREKIQKLDVEYPILIPYREKQHIVAFEEPVAHPITDPQNYMGRSSELDKMEKMCQTDLHASLYCGSCGKPQKTEIQDLQDKYEREQMVREVEEGTDRLQPEYDVSLMGEQARTKQECFEIVENLQSFLRELQKRNVSVQHEEKQHKDELELFVSYLHDHSKKLISFISELRKQHKEELWVHVSELRRQHKEELDARVSELQDLHKELISAHISELQQQHETQVEHLETTHLSKLDTIESSFLREIQVIRDEHKHNVADLEALFFEKMHAKENEMQKKHAMVEKETQEQHEKELMLAQELLRNELAALHMEEMRAVTERLERAHKENLKENLDEQLQLLEEKKSQALDALREEVLRLEEQNQQALQELQDLHRLDIQQQSLERTNRLQEEMSNLQEQLQKYELLMTELNSQRQALSAELQQKAEQHVRFQEEIELLKCQSEMLLEQQITQLKDEFEAEKQSALKEKEKMLSGDVEKLQIAHKIEMDHMLHEKNKEILELQEKVTILTKEMETTGSQLETLTQRRERENQEAENLVEMLRSDVQSVQQEQKRAQNSSQRLFKLLSEILRNTMSTEDLIAKKIGLCLDSSLSQLEESGNGMQHLKNPMSTSVFQKGSELPESNEKHFVSHHYETVTEHSLMSSDEGCELSEYLCESLLGSLELGLENEEKILHISQRLRAAVERLLEMITESAAQLEQTQELQHRFEEEFNRRNQETAQVVIQNQELLKQLAQETEAKNHLQVELHKAQGLINGFTAEKASMEEVLSGKENAEHFLAVELEKSHEQLKILTQESSVFGYSKEVLLKLQEILSGNVQDVEMELVKETERLTREKLELHCQAKKDRSNLLSQMKVLEMELEEQMSRNQELLKKTTEVSDLQQQIQSLEKQLKNQRQFMDEQAVEREHERDDFQQEILKLEEQLKQALKNQGDSRTHGLHEWSVQLETLEAKVKEKDADCNLLLQGRNDLEQQIAESNDELDKMLMRIQELEQAALSNAEAAKKCSKLEAELQNMVQKEQELLQDKDALQHQQLNNVLQISALQSKLDEARHRLPLEAEPGNDIKEQLLAEREALFKKEKEAESLYAQLEQFSENLMNKTEEIRQLKLQLEMVHKQSELTIHQIKEENSQLKDDLSSLQMHWDHKKDNSSLKFPQALLQEKNQEIDHLNEQLVRLQHELESVITDSQSTEIEDLRSLVEHLRSDLERVQKDKEEEVEQLHEVIEKLQHELEQLGPNRHEVSDSQESLDQLGLGEVENLQKELRKGSREASGEKATEIDKDMSVKEDLQQLYVHEIEELQHQLKEKEVLFKTEVEVLEQNLHNLKESNRQQKHELSSLHMQDSSLQEERDLLMTRLTQREAEVADLSNQIQDLEDALRQREASLIEMELLVRTVQEQRAADISELECQLAQRDACLELSGTELKELHAHSSVMNAELCEQKAALQEILEKCSKEQPEKEEKYKYEITELKQHLSESKGKVQTLTKALQMLETHKNLQSPLISEPYLTSQTEKMTSTELAAVDGSDELHKTVAFLTRIQNELAELKSDCHCRGVIDQVLQQQLEVHFQSRGAQVQKLQADQVYQQNLDTALLEEQARKRTNNLQNKDTSVLRSPVRTRSYTESLPDLSTWDSPEMVRKQEDHIYNMRVITSLSDLSIDHSTDLPSKSFATHELGSCSLSLVESCYSLPHSSDTQRTSLVGGTESISGDSSSYEYKRSNIKCDKSDELDYAEDVKKVEVESADVLLPSEQPEVEDTEMQQSSEELDIHSRSERMHSVHLQNMLQMVHEESCKILALSEQPVRQMASSPRAQPVSHITWQQEKQNLQDAIQSLCTALAKASEKLKKDVHDIGEDWRGELLNCVHSLLESEREYLHMELHSHLSQPFTGDKGSLMERVDHVAKEQELQKRLVLEHLLASDRNSLLSEIQDLRSQMKISHLQNQEKLQQLQETLISTEEKGCTKEHQLRKKVELLEYKLQQEVSISEDLKSSLCREKERASEQHKLLIAEQSSANQLRTELGDARSEQERLINSHMELKTEMTRLRDLLKHKEEEVSEYLHSGQMKQEQLNQKTEEEKILVQQIQELKEKTLQELTLSLEEQRVQKKQLSVALHHEQSCNSNLRNELQIEQSRFEALLTQERSKLLEAIQELEKEKLHIQSLQSALTQEHAKLEQLRFQHTQELSRQEQEKLQEHNKVLALQNQLAEERSQAKELVVMIEKTKQQTVSSKRQLEAEVQASQENTRKEQETSSKLRAMLESLQSQKNQMEITLQRFRERESYLQKERDQYQAQLLTLQEQERTWTKEREKERKKEQQAEIKAEREEERERRILDLQLQHERDQHRIRELQNMLADLDEQERALASRKALLQNELYTPERHVSMHKQDPEKVWQQLSDTVLSVKEWIQSCPGRTLKDCAGEKALKSLLETISELKLLLLGAGSLSPVQSSSTLMDVLLSENKELTNSVTLLTEEKQEMRNQLTKLNKKMQQLPSTDKQICPDDSLDSSLEMERAMWHKERQVLQNALKQTESELKKLTSEIENRPVPDVSSIKMQRLYRRYLRAESFRKALVYQKKYLLLLIGGFQACEKATLSLIARMGVYPSPTDLQVPTTCKTGLSKFRSAARVVIAISRLKFLVKKWQKTNRKGENIVQSSVLLPQGPLNRTDILRQQQIGSILLTSPPTRDVPSYLRPSPNTMAGVSPKSTYWTHSRLSPSPVTNPDRSWSITQDPEHSLTQYIRHLEAVQERLGGLQNGSSPDRSHMKSAWK